MAFVLGRNHKLYVQTTGGPRLSWPGAGFPPGLAEVLDAADVTFTGDADTADVSTRGSGAFRAQVATLRDAEAEFNIVYDAGDPILVFLRNAWKNGTVFGTAIFDGPVSAASSNGLWFDGIITGFTWNQELEEAGTVEVTIDNTFSAVAFELITTGAGGTGWTTTTTSNAFFNVTVTSAHSFSIDWKGDGTAVNNYVGTGASQSVGRAAGLGPNPFITIGYDKLLAIDTTIATDLIFKGALPNLEPFINLAVFRMYSQEITGYLPDLSKLTALTTWTFEENGGFRIGVSGAFPTISALPLVTFSFPDGALDYTGAIPTLPSTIQSFKMVSAGITGSIPTLPTSIITFDVSNMSSAIRNNLTGAIPNLAGNTNLIDFIAGRNSGINGHTGSSVAAALKNVRLNNTSLPVASVNAILVQLDSAGATNGFVDLQGTVAPSGAGITAKTNLQGKGWTVLTA